MDEFNVTTIGEFANITAADGNAVVEVVESGFSFQTPEDQKLVPVAKKVKTNPVSGDLKSMAMLAASKINDGDENPVVDEHGFTDADYARIFDGDADGEEILKLVYAADQKKENGELIKKHEIRDFPIDPADMTFDFLHEWLMIRMGRKDELMAELSGRLMSRFNSVMAENTEKAENDDSLTNVTLETYAKLGALQEMNGLVVDYGEEMDFLQPDKSGATLLARLCIFPCDPQTHQYCRAVSLLMSNSKNLNADVNRKTNCGTTALMIASKAGEFCKVIRLMKAGAYINMADRKGRTALTLASERGHQEIVRLLLCNGANCESMIWTAPNALTVAEMNGHSEIGAILKNHCKKFWDEIRRIGDRVDGRIILKDPVMPLFIWNLRESSSFTAQFRPESDAFKNSEWSAPNLLFLVCVEKGPAGQFVLNKSISLIKTVRLNGSKEISVTENKEAINVLTMTNLRQNAINEIRVRFQNVPPDSQVRLVLQGFVCDISGLEPEIRERMNESRSAQVTPMTASNSVGVLPKENETPPPPPPVDEMLMLALSEVFGDD